MSEFACLSSVQSHSRSRKQRESWTRSWVELFYGLMSNSTHNRSFRRRVFSGNRLRWCWQPTTNKQNDTCIWTAKSKHRITITVIRQKYNRLANAKTPCDCSVLCLRPNGSLWSCPHSIFRRDVIRQRCCGSVLGCTLMQQRGRSV